MAGPKTYTSPASQFLQDEVYRLGSSPGFRSITPGPSRDFLVLTWGPIIYRTSYEADSKRLIPVFLRSLNDAVSRSLDRTLTGPNHQTRQLEKTYACKVFSKQDLYDGFKENDVRGAFHDYKVSLAIPAAELPSRLRVCLMVDEAVLSNLKANLDLSTMMEQNTDLGRCWVKVVEENFPDSRFDHQPYVTAGSFVREHDCIDDYRGLYRGWTRVALSALVEVLDGIRQMRCLIEYHREGTIYLGEGKWSSV
ncbi:hypothetical protein N7492_007327 [Penicillium capsulatum]|uniref:Uncharacterized protein n=1 Tax=Penicillium capsulatum TaxID=69766 RepID=A0A9W9I4Y9_9EURO|nr:hypothetical protein N7492_007327 [Penicillium capsulatum]